MYASLLKFYSLNDKYLCLIMEKRISNLKQNYEIWVHIGTRKSSNTTSNAFNQQNSKYEQYSRSINYKTLNKRKNDVKPIEYNPLY